MPKPLATTHQIHRCQAASAAMQRIQDAVIAGLHWYVSGTLPADKLQGLIAKMVARYPELAREKTYLHRQKKTGVPIHRLIVFCAKGAPTGTFFLMANEPDATETWLDAKDKTTRPVFWRFHLTRMSKPGKPKATWTWKTTNAEMAELRTRITDTIRHHQDALLQQVIDDAKRWPGMAGIRKDYYELRKHAAHQWGLHLRQGAMLIWPHKGYTRRIATR